jgi:4-hydroxybenzoate polyprenyltransferase
MFKKIINKFLIVLKLMRLHQYVKNLFLFLPLFFVGQITNLELTTNAFVAFIAFSITASSRSIIYCLQLLHVSFQYM